MNETNEASENSDFHELTLAWKLATERRLKFLNDISILSKNNLHVTPEEYTKFLKELSIATAPLLLSDISAYSSSLKNLIKNDTPEETVRLIETREDPAASIEIYTPHSQGHTELYKKIKSKKITKIKSISGQNFDAISKVKRTKLGEFYLNYLKKITLFRLLTEWSWKTLYPVYANNVIAKKDSYAKRWRPIIKLNDYLTIEEAKPINVFESITVETPDPLVHPEIFQYDLNSPHETYDFPQIYIATIKNAEINGGTNFIIKEDIIISHDLFEAESDYTSEELHGRSIIDPRKNQARWLLNDKAPERIPECAVFVDACAPNYAHWLSEVLPRIAIFCNEDNFKNTPIVVNDGLHKNIMQSLQLVAGREREIITLPISRGLNVDKLHLTSVAGYVPFERRDKENHNHSHGKFSSSALQLMKSEILMQIKNLPDQKYPEKIYIRRNSGIRQLINSKEIEAFLAARNYAIIEPEKLDFIQQVRLFSNAKIIIATSGAAVANIIFSSKQARIFILIGQYAETSYWYWQNMACATGGKVSYGLGTIDKSEKLGIHANFHFDVSNFSTMEI